MTATCLAKISNGWTLLAGQVIEEFLDKTLSTLTIRLSHAFFEQVT